MKKVKKVSRVGGSKVTPRPRATASKSEPVRTMTKSEVLRRVRGLDVDRRNAMVCALVGHSRIQSACFGYFNCGRCDAQVGDTLGGIYSGALRAVIVGHDCPKCRENFKSLTWRDTLFSADPFPKRELERA